MGEQTGTFDYAGFITLLEMHNWRYVLCERGNERDLGSAERMKIVTVLKDAPYEAKMMFHAYRKAYDPSYNENAHE